MVEFALFLVLLSVPKYHTTCNVSYCIVLYLSSLTGFDDAIFNFENCKPHGLTEHGESSYFNFYEVKSNVYAHACTHVVFY